VILGNLIPVLTRMLFALEQGRKSFGKAPVEPTASRIALTNT
jgi:hypothetical protein